MAPANETIVPIMLPAHQGFSHSLEHSHWVGTHSFAQTELHSELCWRAISKLHTKKPDYNDTCVLLTEILAHRAIQEGMKLPKRAQTGSGRERMKAEREDKREEVRANDFVQRCYL